MNSDTPTPMRDRLNDLLDAAHHLFGQRGSTWEQFRRYTAEHLDWCRSQGIDPPVDVAMRIEYRMYLERVGKVTNQQSWKVRATVLNKLPAAVAEVRRRDGAAAARWRTRLIDALPVSSDLAVAIDERCAGKSRSYRASIRADVAVVLEWCLARGVDPTRLAVGQVTEFERWLADRGRRSRGPAMAARWLHRRFYEPAVWWR